MARRQQTKGFTRSGQTLDTRAAVAGGQMTGPVTVDNKGQRFLEQLSTAKQGFEQFMGFQQQKQEETIQLAAQQQKMELNQIGRETEIINAETAQLKQEIAKINFDDEMEMYPLKQQQREAQIKQLEDTLGAANAQKVIFDAKSNGQDAYDVLANAQSPEEVYHYGNYIVRQELAEYAQELSTQLAQEAEAGMTVDADRYDALMYAKLKELRETVGLNSSEDISTETLESFNKANDALVSLAAQSNSQKSLDITKNILQQKIDTDNANTVNTIGFMPDEAEDILSKRYDAIMKSSNQNSKLAVQSIADIIEGSKNPIGLANQILESDDERFKNQALRDKLNEVKARASSGKSSQSVQSKAYVDLIQKTGANLEDKEVASTVFNTLVEKNNGDVAAAKKGFEQIQVKYLEKKNTQIANELKLNEFYLTDRTMEAQDIKDVRGHLENKIANISFIEDPNVRTEKTLEYGLALVRNRKMTTLLKDSSALNIARGYDLTNKDDFLRVNQIAQGLIMGGGSNGQALVDGDETLSKVSNMLLRAGGNPEKAFMYLEKDKELKAMDKIPLPLNSTQKQYITGVMNIINKEDFETNAGIDIPAGGLNPKQTDRLQKFLEDTMLLDSDMTRANLLEVAKGYIKSDITNVQGIDIEGTGYTPEQYNDMIEDRDEMFKQAALAVMAEQGVTDNVSSEYAKVIDNLERKDYILVTLQTSIDGNKRFVGYTQDGTPEFLTKKPINAYTNNRKTLVERTTQMERVMEADDKAKEFSEDYYQMERAYELTNNNRLKKAYKKKLDKMDEEINQGKKELLSRDKITTVKPIINTYEDLMEEAKEKTVIAADGKEIKVLETQYGGLFDPTKFKNKR